MNKKLIALAIAAGLTAPMAANAAPTVYGKVHVSIDSMSYDQAGTDDNLVVASNSSRIGFKGSEDLGGGLKAIWKLESGIAADGESGSLSARNRFIGLNGNFGTILAGKHDTPLKGLSRKVELFPEHIGDNRNVLGSWDNRWNNAIQYSSPKIGGNFQINAMYSADTGATGNTDNNDNDATSISLVYTASNLYAGIATETINSGATDRSATRMSASYKMGPHRVVGLYQMAETTAGDDENVMGLGYAMSMGKNVFKIQYFTTDNDGTNADADLMAVGLDHKLSKKTTAYITYASIDNDSGASYRVNAGGHGDTFTPSAGNSPSGISVGMIHNF